MSRESLIIISRLIVVVIFCASLVAMAVGDFLVTLIVVCGGTTVWLLYLVSAGLGSGPAGGGTATTLGKSISKVVAGLGGILAISAFITYGMEQTIWGGWAFNVTGVALALAILWITLMPLVVLQLIGSTGAPEASGTGVSGVAPSDETQPQSATPLPDQQLFYGAPYSEELDAYDQDQYADYDEEDGDWEGYEEDEDEEYDEDEEDQYEDDEYEEDEEDEDEEDED